jgi:ribonuclease HII
VTPPPSAPYRYEAQAWRTGVANVAGLDEAGRGPLAGPVVAAAVIVAPDRRIRGLRDSKLLPPERREALYAEILARAIAVGVGVIDQLTIDRVNILEATRLAMREALAALAIVPDLVITDFVTLRELPCPQRTRDRIMVEADKQFPDYGFAQHKGYATPDHLAALDRHGPCALHRRSFAGVWRQGELFVLEADD